MVEVPSCLLGTKQKTKKHEWQEMWAEHIAGARLSVLQALSTPCHAHAKDEKTEQEDESTKKKERALQIPAAPRWRRPSVLMI